MCDAGMSKKRANMDLLDAAWEICLMALDSSQAVERECTEAR